MSVYVLRQRYEIIAGKYFWLWPGAPLCSRQLDAAVKNVIIAVEQQLHCSITSQLTPLSAAGAGMWAQDTMSLEGHCSYTIFIKIIFYRFHSCATQIWCYVTFKSLNISRICSSAVISMFMFLMRLKDLHNGKHLVFIYTVISHVDTHDSHMILETCLGGGTWPSTTSDTRHRPQHQLDGSCPPSLLSVMMAAMMSGSSTWHCCYVNTSPQTSVGLQFANLRQARVPCGAVICGNKLLHMRLDHVSKRQAHLVSKDHSPIISLMPASMCALGLTSPQ